MSTPIQYVITGDVPTDGADPQLVEETADPVAVEQFEVALAGDSFMDQFWKNFDYQIVMDNFRHSQEFVEKMKENFDG